MIWRDTGGLTTEHTLCNYETALNEYLLANIGTLSQEYIWGPSEKATLYWFAYHNKWHISTVDYCYFM